MEAILERLPFKGLIDSVRSNIRTSITLVIVALVVSCASSVLMATMLGNTKAGGQITEKYANGFKLALGMSIATSALLIFASINGFMGFRFI